MESEAAMNKHGRGAALGFLIFIFLASCAPQAQKLEPAAADSAPTELTGQVLEEGDRSAVPSTAMPLPIASEDTVSGETDVLLDVPNLDELQPGTGDSAGEVSSGIISGETIVSESSSLAQFDLKNEDGRIGFARQDLANNLGLDVAEVKFLGYQNKIWPDGNLGCVQKGQRFTPAEIPGYLILLEAGGKEYAYRGGAGRKPFLCTNKQTHGIEGKEVIQPPAK